MSNWINAWQFNTKRFSVVLLIAEIYGYQYDGDDEDGETQRQLDSGELIAFDSRLLVYLDGQEVGGDALGSSVYKADNLKAFWTDHRDPDPMNRNCEAFRAKHGEKSAIGHYFPEMVRNAITEARDYLANVPKMRNAA